MIRGKKWYKVWWIWVIIVVIILILVGLFSDAQVQSASKNYTIPEVKAQDAVTEEINFKTAQSGEYTIGKAPKDMVSGKEKEFTTEKSGEYIAGEDFPVGVYDIEAVDGYGNVMGTGLNEIMSSNDNLTSDIDGDIAVEKYDNKEFKDGDKLKVSDVSVKLIPQTNDDKYIPAGTYDLKAIKGYGNVTGAGQLNEILGTNDLGDTGLSSDTYDNAKFKNGQVLKITGVELEIKSEKPIVVKPATKKTPAKDIEEKIEIKPDGTETCYVNNTESSCSDLKYQKELEQKAKSS